MSRKIYQHLCDSKERGEKKFAVLIDPDQLRLDNLEQVIELAIAAHVDYFFVGGSLIIQDKMDATLRSIKEKSSIPTVLFPGSPNQINHSADALLFLSLISGRNADLLIGQHVISAPMLRNSPLEILPTGYMLVDGGTPTTASYISGTTPIPSHKDEIAYCTAFAGELLGLKTIYMDAGSGAKNPISESMIRAVARGVNIPLIVGGGIRTPEKAAANAQAGADVVVVGNAFEKDPSLILEIAQAIHETSKIMNYEL